MPTQSDVRRIALALPGVAEGTDRFGFSIEVKGKAKGLAWVWLERVDPKQARIPNPTVLAVRVANVAQRDLMIAAEPRKFFTEPHYNGYPAVLVRLDAVTTADLEMLLEEAWRVQGGGAATEKRRTAKAAKVAKKAPAKKAPAKKAVSKKAPAKQRPPKRPTKN